MKEITDILATIQPVIARSRWVSIDQSAIDRTAVHLAAGSNTLPDWDAELHPDGRDAAETATLVLVLDALNFCFWPMPGSTAPRWSVEYRDRVYDGYLALAVALRKAVDEGVPLADPDYLAELDQGQVRALLAPVPGAQEIPLIEARLANLREVGQALRERWDGSFRQAILDAGGSALGLIDEVIAVLPSFQDTASYRGSEVLFYKRAQILIADLHGALAGDDLGQFDDLDRLTAFADYKVPQILRQFGILQYDRDLATTIRHYELIPQGDKREIEIRAATVWAVEMLRQALEDRGRSLRAFEIDWLLWHGSQRLAETAEPYHRTLTIYY